MSPTVLYIIFFISIAFNVFIFILFLVSKKSNKHYEMMKSSPTTSDSDTDEIDSFILEETGIPVTIKKKKPIENITSPPSIRTKLLQLQRIQNLITYATIGSVCLAIAIGIILRLWTKEKWSKRSLMYLAFPGEIYLRMLESLILPLIIAGPIAALGKLDFQLLNKIGMRTIIYCIMTTVLAISLGVVLVLIVSPGVRDENLSKGTKLRNVTIEDKYLDLIRNLFPRNLVEACLSQYKTFLEKPDNIIDNTTKNTTDISIYDFKIKHEYVLRTNLIGIVFFSIIFGVIINRMQSLAFGKPLLDVFVAINEIGIIISNFVIRFTPIGIFFLLMSKIISAPDVQTLLGGIGSFSLVVIAGGFIHGFVVLPAIYFVIIRKNPYSFINQMIRALMTAFGTSSSLATLPVTINCLEKTRLDKRVVRFVVPIGRSINMDGTALYDAVATIFIAKVRGKNLDLAKVVKISVTAAAASIGAAGELGFSTMIMVLEAIGLPAEDTALIIAVDWFMNRYVTAINVLSDCIGAAIVDHLSRDDLKKFGNKK